MTALLTWSPAMHSYDNERSGEPDTFPCTPFKSGLMTAGAAAFVIAVASVALYFWMF